ncbi:biotin carboxyl carrier protein [Rhodoferax ferrireducens T118]|jgi:biotin carboxyl carrier protein|uniref:Biotin carboxyl carrier protein of acetyl-CoA carboxylase n=1 Tax=Albidiferax ferrireducens (strain ATCC BAA-621 / DSM 15236 / T118) TaxID=338969 RepID=Q223B4_ALBFT|nr:acetyl-CoA carboxylase [Rhodoferax ferrireducens]ABD67889.1 biotin carboxyl carrier protein [Rhodoferax ferrireducens T118]WPC67043.1 acetyl-CoA carboxylase [Rhodoferax ferrireducens]
MAEIISPLPGTFYRRPAPDAPNYKQVGDSVAIDEVIGLVEVMKMFNEVRAEVSGKVVRYTIDNEDPVEAGQVLMIIE